MKAVVYTQYGSPDVLKLQEIPQPVLQTDDSVLVKVHAAAANPADWHLMRGEPFLARLDAGLFKPRNIVLGQDIAGVVEAVGKNVSQFKVGDAVFGEIFKARTGGFAEYTCVPQEALVSIPSNLSFAQAAAVPLAAVTALQGLRNYGQIQAGEKVLVNGASGGVGTFAVQIAKYFGAQVTGVCSTSNVELVRSIGADFVIDYTQTDFTQSGQRYDLIFDMVGNRKIGKFKGALAADGRCIVGGFTTLPHLFHIMLGGAWASRWGKQKISQMPTAEPNQKDLLFIKDLLEKGELMPIIDRTYPLSQTADAIRYLETGRAKGKVIVVVAE